MIAKQKEIEIQELKEEIKYNEKLYLGETKISNAYRKKIDYMQAEINKLQNIIKSIENQNKNLREQNKFLLKKKAKEIRMSTKIVKKEAIKELWNILQDYIFRDDFSVDGRLILDADEVKKVIQRELDKWNR